MSKPALENTYQKTVRQDIHRSASLSVPFMVMNGLATIMASYGITGIALALVVGDAGLLHRADFPLTNREETNK